LATFIQLLRFLAKKSVHCAF